MDIEHNNSEVTSSTVDLKNDLIPKLRNMGQVEHKLGSLTLFRKCIEEVQRIAQPYKSNYKHFQ